MVGVVLTAFGANIHFPAAILVVHLALTEGRFDDLTLVGSQGFGTGKDSANEIEWGVRVVFEYELREGSQAARIAPEAGRAPDANRLVVFLQQFVRQIGDRIITIALEKVDNTGEPFLGFGVVEV